MPGLLPLGDHRQEPVSSLPLHLTLRVLLFVDVVFVVVVDVVVVVVVIVDLNRQTKI